MADSMTRRSAMRLLLMTSGAALISACTASPSVGPTSSAVQPTLPPTRTTPTPAVSTSTTTSQVPAVAEPRSGGTLRLGFLGDLLSLDPHFPAGTIGTTINNLFDRLGTEDAKLNFQPRLAESFERTDDLKQLKLTLRKGVQFHSGRELTAEDVKWNIDRVRDPKVGGGILSNYAKLILPVEMPDKYTLILKTDQPWPPVFDFLHSLIIVDPVAMESQGQAYLNPVGTGPFQFVEYLQGDHITFKKNPNYWQSGRPYLDEIHIQIFHDPLAMITSLEAGAIDATASIPPPREIARLHANPGFRAVTAQPAQDTYLFAFNTSSPLGSNKLLRQAMNWALDRERIASTLLVGLSQPRNLPWAATSAAYDPAKDRTYTFDLDRARSLLAASGVSNPVLDFNYSTALAEWASIGALYQSDVAKIGITLNLQPTDPPTLLGLQVGSKYAGATHSVQVQGGLHPSIAYSSPWFNPTVNWIGLKDPAFDQWATQMQFEADPVKAKALYDRWNDYQLDQAMTMGVATYTRGVLTSSKVNGFEYTMIESLEYGGAWLS